ncbi:nucleotide pyrophosphohydrolase [Candidatus Woesearchaeota archaeon]|nr:nucleotide pyrophosphohydrolase [Candidatus Woesearchaeota archaeon]
MKESFESFVKKVEQLHGLHDHEGCLWDKEQTIESMKKYILEEAEEIAEAIDKKDYDELREELGDLLLNITHICTLAKQQSLFSYKDVIKQVEEKIVRRHPHVFGNATFGSLEEIKAHWKKTKAEEKRLKEEKRKNNKT